jgi:hypothetical protein
VTRNLTSWNAQVAGATTCLCASNGNNATASEFPDACQQSPLDSIRDVAALDGEVLPLNTPNCATLPARGRQFGERGGSLARRRYQKGRVFLRGIKNSLSVGRWREDVIENGRVRRIERSEVLGSKSDYPTKRLAQRELDKRLAVVNDPRYRPRPTATFAEFASGWESRVLTQHKPSTQVTIRSHLRKHLVPYFGRWQMKDIGTLEVQTFVSSIGLSAKTKKNLFATMQMLWKSARVWGYVAHDAVSGKAFGAGSSNLQRVRMQLGASLFLLVY